MFSENQKLGYLHGGRFRRGSARSPRTYYAKKIFWRTPLNFRRTSAGIFGQKSGYRLSLPLAALSRSINDLELDLIASGSFNNLELDLIVALSPILECLKLCSRVHCAVKTLKTDPMKQTKYISILSCLNNQSLCAAI